MSVEPVSCTIKSPVALQIGDTVSDLSRPGVYITDITLAEPVNIQEISFKNYYTAYLTVRVQQREDGSVKWVTCLRNHCLMANPHAEAGSHDYFSIYRQQDTEWDVPAWLSTLTPVETSLDLKGLPDPETVSSSIQQMWALTEIMQASQNAASIGRFDVDGSYDVKLLSYM
ncbi:nicolin-1 isoform X2 [Triplophysa rosa]|uniref:nicolin-1 isoform X2 n=1 Tax=Triplophysa rosa TaxID=992332 RepID=UPI0025461057|nr:nicolin-1 isoform X2 [Triplophysa rosa]